MEKVISNFNGFPSQKSVAMVMLRHGIRVSDGTAYCGNIMISDTALGKAAGVDRRVVRSTIDHIESIPLLKSVFSKLNSMSLLSDVAPFIGCTTLEIIPVDARIPGILADVTKTIYDAGISVRQAVVDDPGLQKDAHLIIVLDGQLPPEYIPKLKSCRGVDSIIIR
jgi:uncharacterized protein